VTQLDDYVADYAQRYMASDADAIATLCEVPLLAVRDGRAIHLEDATAVRDHFASLMAAYAKAGAARAEVASLDVRELGSSSAIATVRWHVLDAAGGPLRDFSTTYHLLRDGNSWRILSYTNHDG